jgi:crotonobetainyl-CoA:carnitine CoA-transferase CaiB-like acyl-CoA transferase
VSLRQKDSRHWLAAFEANDVPCGPINSIDQVFKDPQIIAREMLINVSDSRSGSLKMVGNPIKYSRTHIEYPASPPQLGEQTHDVLQDYLEYSEYQLTELQVKGII